MRLFALVVLLLSAAARRSLRGDGGADADFRISADADDASSPPPSDGLRPPPTSTGNVTYTPYPMTGTGAASGIGIGAVGGVVLLIGAAGGLG